MTRILGISAYYHDSAAALVVDGEIVAAAQQERFSRRKHDERFPLDAVAYCLKVAGITADQLDYVCFYDNPAKKLRRLLATYLAYAPRGSGSFRQALPSWLTHKLFMKRALRRTLGLPGSTP
ncbi:MAG: carbamoyltransferase N-terminal domain-containing protein, partial [Vicinamibacterales bacterium]|nr:carbamoyltransferase N-terminal domain-containing protein [Vicinamibacterales bacterium]